MKNTDRRVAVVIGAGDATGGAIAKRFAKEGYAVVVTRRQKEALEGLAQSIRNDGGDVHAFGCDARNETDMESMFKGAKLFNSDLS
ncbi:SDR family NAD(P)-dependent oxidoreductase, partial [Spongiibacter sp.]|uniref:SDR family NAD(P)-dependent oxidoreductase n=1 Tax=Spongiibacter sp. TaxID=2024860 RepID=UPI00257F6DED